ncbi:peptidase C39 family protein [Candidatus Woesearchaeota archaeon]|nr:peptidase C39 family protein [Candidatus Woesearchaeota archaeon]
MKAYVQTTEYTSGAACLLMVLNHFDAKVKFSRDKEFELWQRIAMLPSRSGNVYAMGRITHAAKIPTTVVVGEKDYRFPLYRFYKMKLKEVKDTNFMSQKFYREAVEAGVDIEIRAFDIEEVKRLLQDGKVIIIRLNSSVLINERKPFANFFVLYGFADRSFDMMDPFHGERKVEESMLSQMFETVRTKCKRDNRMVILG